MLIDTKSEMSTTIVKNRESGRWIDLEWESSTSLRVSRPVEEYDSLKTQRRGSIITHEVDPPTPETGSAYQFTRNPCWGYTSWYEPQRTFVGSCLFHIAISETARFDTVDSRR